MKISEIKNNQGSINLEADVIDVGPVREINKYGKNLRVANATLKDESGKIKLTLWNQEVDKVHKGDKVKVTNGYAKAFQDELQLTAGKFGKIEVVGKSTSSSEDEGENEEVEVVSSEKSEMPRTNIVKPESKDGDDEEGLMESDEEEW